MFKAAFVLGALEQSFSGAFLKRLGDTVHLDLVCLSLFCFFMSLQPDWMMMIRSDLCVEHKNLTGLLQLMAK